MKMVVTATAFAILNATNAHIAYRSGFVENSDIVTSFNGTSNDPLSQACNAQRGKSSTMRIPKSRV